MHRNFAPLAAALLLAACGGGREEAPTPEPSPAERDTVPTATIPPPPPVAEPTPAPEPANDTEAAAPPATIPGARGHRMETMPAAMRGTWAGEGGRCARSSDMRLEVAGDRLTFYESVARPTAITRGQGQSIAVQLEFSGEGETWTERQSFTLLQGGRRLVRAMPDGGSVTYARCNSQEDL